MEDNNVSVESVELALLSEIGMPSAIMMKNAYSSYSGQTADDERYIPYSEPADSLSDDGLAGPNALVYITKLLNPTPDAEIEKFLLKDPGRKPTAGSHDFYTLVLCMSMRLGDPSTTRFINGTIEVAFPKGVKILTYSPREKGSITSIIEHGGDAIALSPGLIFLASDVKGTKHQLDPQENRFGIPVGPGEKITGSYRKKNGYSFNIPVSALLEYQGMLKNDHEMFWEIYPPMPGQDIEVTGKEMLAVFSFIVQVPKKSTLTITARIEGRVKGNLWGVIPVKGSVVLP